MMAIMTGLIEVTLMMMMKSNDHETMIIKKLVWGSHHPDYDPDCDASNRNNNWRDNCIGLPYNNLKTHVIYVTYLNNYNI